MKQVLRSTWQKQSARLIANLCIVPQLHRVSLVFIKKSSTNLPLERICQYHRISLLYSFNLKHKTNINSFQRMTYLVSYQTCTIHICIRINNGGLIRTMTYWQLLQLMNMHPFKDRHLYYITDKLSISNSLQCTYCIRLLPVCMVLGWKSRQNEPTYLHLVVFPRYYQYHVQNEVNIQESDSWS